MANKKLTELTELTTVALADLLYVVDDPAGTPIGKKATVENIISALTPLSETATASASDAHTGNGAWQDINSMSVSVTPQITSDLLCIFTCSLLNTDTVNWEYTTLRFDLDGSSQSYGFLRSLDVVVGTKNPRHIYTIHWLFKDVSASSHTIKAQWSDNSSGQDATIYDRALTVISIPQ